MLGNINKLKAVTIMLMLILLLGACKKGYDPAEGWQTSTAAKQGMDPEILANFIKHIDKNNYDIHNLLIIRNGYIVTEAAFYPSKPDNRHYQYSVTKSFTSTLIGIAIDKGFIKGVESKVIDFFPDRTIANLDDKKRELTVGHLLTMTDGMDWPEWESGYGHPENPCTQLAKSSDWGQFMLDRKIIKKPGSGMRYNSGASHLLMVILERATGMNTLDFARQNLFEPLGITDLFWGNDNKQVNIGGWGLSLTPRDMAKLGYLYLNGGKWGGRRIVSKKWCQDSWQKGNEVQASGLKNTYYGYHWWLDPEKKIYSAQGSGGQYIIVMPEYDLVAVITANQDSNLGYTMLESIITGAAKTGVPDNKSNTGLEEAIKKVSNEPEAGPAQSLSPLAVGITEKKIIHHENEWGIKSVTLTFNESEAVVDFVIEEQKEGKATFLNERYYAGFDNTYRYAENPDRYFEGNTIVTAARAQWETPDTFVIEFWGISRAFDHNRATLQFDGRKVNMLIQNLESKNRIRPFKKLTGYLEGF